MAHTTLVGLGAIGAAYASRFVAAGVPLEVVADPVRAERYRREATVVNGVPHHFEVADPASARAADLVVVSVKYGQLPAAIELLRPVVGPGTVMLSLLNGISSEQVLAEAFPQARVLLAVSAGIDAVRDGRDVRFTSLGVISYGESRNSEPFSEAVRLVAGVFDQTGIAHDVPADMVHTLWWKFLVNVGVNQVSAVLKAPYATFQRPGSPAREVMLAAQREVIAVANAAGVGLGEADLRRWLEVLGRLGPANYTSMAQDAMAGRRTEVDIFAGEVIQRGAALGVDVPVNATLYGLLKAAEPWLV